MPVEIKELVIKLRVEESTKKKTESIDKKALKADLLKEVRKEVRQQLRLIDER